MRATNEQGEKWQVGLFLVVAFIITVLVAAGLVNVRFPAAESLQSIQPDVERKNQRLEELSKPVVP